MHTRLPSPPDSKEDLRQDHPQKQLSCVYNQWSLEKAGVPEDKAHLSPGS